MTPALAFLFCCFTLASTPCHSGDGCLRYPLIPGFKTVRLYHILLGITQLKGVCNSKSILVEKDIPLDVDAGFLTVTDTNPIDTESYGCIPPSQPPTYILFLSEFFFHT
jgi:hypothetical protein